MYETPDYEEIYGSDPNDAKHFEPKGAAPKVWTGPKSNTWIVVGRVGDDPKAKVFALKMAEGGLYWFRPSSKDCKITEKITLFTDIKEADQAMFAARDLFPELTVWVMPL